MQNNIKNVGLGVETRNSFRPFLRVFQWEYYLVVCAHDNLKHQSSQSSQPKLKDDCKTCKRILQCVRNYYHCMLAIDKLICLCIEAWRELCFHLKK